MSILCLNACLLRPYVVCHSTLTVNQTYALEWIQKICIKVIQRVSNLDTLEVWWIKYLLNKNHRFLFPGNVHDNNLRDQNQLTVVKNMTDILRRSCILYIQRILKSRESKMRFYQCDKGIEFLPQTQIFWSQYLCNLMVQT